MKAAKIILLLTLTSAFSLKADVADKRKIAEHLQDISVTIKAEGEYSKSEGSGVLITREIGGEKVTFVWTAGHVIDNLRNTREIVDDRGQTRKVVEFDDPKIVKELVEGGRRVGEIKMDAVVVKYSDADNGEDLAVLMVRARDYGKDSAAFYLNKDEPIVPIGTQLYHVGSLLGQKGSNSMTTGIVSQVGRTLGKVEFDQTTVTAFPGSSGGGVYLQDGKYVGMLVRGAGENFNLIVPVRRIKRWAKEMNIEWAIDPSIEAPSMDTILDLPVESTFKKLRKGGAGAGSEKNYPFLIRKSTLKKTLE